MQSAYSKWLIGVVIVSAILLAAVNQFGWFTNHSGNSVPQPESISYYFPDRHVETLPNGKEILAVRNMSRDDASDALVGLDKLIEKNAFADEPMLQAYQLMIESNIATLKGEVDLVEEIAEKLAHIANEHNLSWLLAESQAELAIKNILSGDLDQATELIQSAIQYADSINYAHAQIKNYNTAGVIASTQGELLAAQEYFHRGIKLAEALPGHVYHPKLVSNIALIYIFLEDWEKSLAYLEQGQKFYQESDEYSSSGQIILHSNQAYAYFRLGDADKARAAYEKALNLFESETHDLRTKLIVLRTEAEINWLEGNHAQAIEAGQQCINIEDQDSLALEVGVCYMILGKAQASSMLYEEAMSSFEGAHEFIKKADAYYYLAEVYLDIAETSEALDLNEKALEYYKLYYYLNKTLLFDRRQSELFLLQERFDNEALLHQKAMFRSDAEIARLSVETQRLRNWFVLAFIFSVVMVFIHIRRDAQTTKSKNEALVESVQQDPMTGIGNRRYVEHWLKEYKAWLGKRSYVVALVDIDNFKVLNDTYGHHAGDDVIVETANRLEKSLQDHEAVARWGGEEFVLILKNNKDLSTRIEKIVHSISNTVYEADSAQINVTISLGVSQPSCGIAVGTSFELLAKQADIALYKAKSQGKNQAQFYTFN